MIEKQIHANDDCHATKNMIQRESERLYETQRERE